MEDVGPEPRNVGQENFIGRKFFRSLTSRLFRVRSPAFRRKDCRILVRLPAAGEIFLVHKMYVYQQPVISGL